jgi:type II secretory pathway pseudopilin PulG
MLFIRVSRIVSRSGEDESGFSLLEAIIASGLMAGALAALGQMFAISVANNRSARAASYATVLAQQKMEQLRGLTWGFDTLGLPISDTTSNTAAPVETPTGGTGLSLSPAGTLTSNTDGWVDYVDQSGNALGSGTTLPPGTVYIRRWAVEPLPSSPADTIVLHVFVTTRVGRGEARLISLKTRKMQ